MGIDISPYLGTLLYKNKIAILPGFGALIAKDCRAVLDHAAGKLYPPASLVSFSVNAASNNEALNTLLQREESISSKEADECIAASIQFIYSRLELNEKVHFKSIGTFYLGTPGEITFEADPFTSFDSKAYGLPELTYSALKRTTESDETKVAGNNVHDQIIEEEIPGRNRERTFWSRPSFIYGLAILGLLGIAISRIVFDKADDLLITEAKTIPTTELRINVKPLPETIANTLPREPIDLSDKQLIDENAAISDLNQSQKEKSDTAVQYANEGNENAEKRQKSIFIVGSFSQSDNIRKVIRQIEQSDNGLYKEKISVMTRLGVVVHYNNLDEKALKVARLRKQFGAEIWELEK
ncbi:MAG: hypothetical protein ACOYOA_09065 [Saprospiraceae bacterium]